MKPRMALCLLTCLFVYTAMAANPFQRGIDAVPIKLTPTLDSGLVLEAVEMQHAGAWSVRLLGDLNFSPLSIKFGNERVGSLIPFRADLHLFASYQPLSRLELAIDLPLTVYQSNKFELFEQHGLPQRAPAAAGLGDLRLIGRYAILTQQQFPIALGAILEIRAPTSNTNHFLGGRGFVLAPRVALERALGPVRILGNVGWRLHTKPGQYLNLYVGQEFMMGLGVLVDLGGGRVFAKNQLLAEFNVVTSAEAPFNFDYADAIKTPMELLLGYRAQIYKNWLFQLHLGRGAVGKNTGYGREAFRVGLGFGYQHLPEPDRDGDGIPDSEDGCPDEPGPKENNGCPYPDRDGDGIVDHLDACPDIPGPIEYDGCPDTDGDEIPDHLDKCPLEPGIPELDGCPPPPEEDEVSLESDRIRIRGTILFDTAKDTIKPESFNLLDNVVELLNRYPEVGPISVEGHTDNVGSRPYNLDLSNRRAKSVVDYLISHGIEPGRLQSIGYGFDRPVAPNDSALGRAKNRRTEFLFKETVPPQPEKEQ
ncbi:MAG: OmpA family protein [Proteobacteria bacterium]|nr:OmpA family protein [Cystobacterineae bacterium]MCL2258521.1 OmpA family protein [Cystobacterineae bacterium]MCL2315250.1 OmpA family protein [Pseudomonadota bacterium]